MPEGLLYQPDFISQDEETKLLAQVARLPLEEAKYKSFTAKRRTVSYGSSYDFDSNRLGSAPALPDFLFALRAKLAALVHTGEYDFRHALVTEYRPGTELGWPGSKIFTLDLAPRSVYVLRDEIRWRWQHSVAATKELRYSITFRTPR